tara:strand:- start:331 stop:867 length:537 start_codon:yes stop_codon:yes gene_type:complete
MWPFGKKTFDLIEDRWLKDKGIPVSYRDAFNRSKRDIKSEISRNNNNIAQSEMKIGEISAEIRENELKKARLSGERDELKTKKGAKHSQELQRITAEIRLATGIIDRMGTEKIKISQTLDNTRETVKMLQMIQSKNVTSPDQLVQSPIWASGDQMEDVMDNLASETGIDNSEFLDSEE